MSARYASAVKPYRRKLSGEGAETGTVLITRDRWKSFPLAGDGVSSIAHG
jgi:hypothetical protein